MIDDEQRPNSAESDPLSESVPPKLTETIGEQTVGEDWQAEVDADVLEDAESDDDGWKPAEPRIPDTDVPDMDFPPYSGRLAPPDPDLATSADDWMPGSSNDVDDALAAVASLSMITDREADDLARSEGVETATPAATRATSAGIPMPPQMALKRGQLASVIPALLLIAGGAYWTFVSTTGGQIDPLLLIGAAVGVLVIALLVGWLNFGRWSRGLIFFALLIVFTVGGIVLTTRIPGLDLPTAYPLLLAAPGLAFIFAAFMARPATSRLLIPGMLLIAAAAVGIIFNAGLLPLNLAPVLPIAAPVVVVSILVLWLLGIIARRRA